MPVSYLELENFKSYEGIQRIGPFKEFTSIIGPNGAGKSNLMDAISFVLGVQSRDLRSSQLKDLIFRPPETVTHQRIDDNDDSSTDDHDTTQTETAGRQLRASATLVYQDPENPMIETRFCRAISSKGIGEYRINDRVVSFAEYERQLKEIGVLLAARNFLVFQGDVESLAQKSPKQIAQLLEQVSGSDELREEYDEALKAKDDAEAATIALIHKVKALRSEAKALKQHKEEALRFQTLIQEKNKITTDFYLWQLYHIEMDIEEKEDSKKQLLVDLDQSKGAETTKAEELRLAKKLASSARKATTLVDKKRVSAAANLDKLQPSLIQVTEEVKNLERKVAADTKALDKARMEHETHAEAALALKREIEDYMLTEEQLRIEYEQKKEEATASAHVLSEEQEAEYERIKDAAAVASAKPRQVLNTQVRKLESVRVKAANLSEELKEAQARKDEATRNVQDFSDRKNKLEKSIDKTKNDLTDAEAALQGVQKQVQEAQVRREAIASELEVIDQKIRDARDEYKKSKDETRLLESIKSLQRHFPGVYGRLVDLCRPTQRRYNLAATVAGGKDMDAIVVDTKETGFECIQYLRNNQIGTATFLPLDTLKIPNPATTERIRAMLQHDSRYKLACDVIACDESMKRALMYAVGNTVICDDLDSARELCFSSQNRQQGEDTRMKAVTIGGAVISKAGTMTGGMSSEENSKAGRWDDKEVEKLKEERENLETEIANLDNVETASHIGSKNRRSSRDGNNSRIEELRSNVGTLRNKLQYSQAELDYSKKRMKEQQALVGNLEKQIETMMAHLNEAETEVSVANDAVVKAGQVVKDVEEELFAPFRVKTGLSDFRAYDQAMGNARVEYQKKRRTILQHLEKLKAQKEYEDRRDFQAIISSKEQALSSHNAQLDGIKKKEVDILSELAVTKEKLLEAETQLKEAEELEKGEEKKLKRFQNEYKEIQSESAALNKQINSIQADLERLRAKLHETLVKARVEEAEILLYKYPLEDGGKKRKRSVDTAANDISYDDDTISSDASIDSSQAKTQESFKSIHFSQADDSRVKRDRKKAESIDFSRMNDEWKERLSDQGQRKVHKDFEDRLSSLTSHLESISPNMKAEEAYVAVTERLEESSIELNTAKVTSTKAAEEYASIKDLRIERFKEAFEHVDEALKRIYNDMTKSSKHPLGGNAYLTIEDTEEPYKAGIKFNAMPPMKRFRDMEQLSGGEKTVAALALLFAISSFRPSPFFVMDEVDAALDNVNVQKVCNYISQRSKDIQFIVISLKDLFYEKSDGLIGICRHVPTNSSRTLTLDLTKFDRESAAGRSSTNGGESSRKRSRLSLDMSMPIRHAIGSS